MKVLTDKQHADLQSRADAYDQIVASIVGAGQDITAADITAETVIKMVQPADTAAEIVDLQPQLDTANARVTELETQLDTANTRISELEADIDNQPAEQTATIAPKAETTVEKVDIIDFAAKNQDDPFAILAKAEKEGLI
ncbi:MAG: hypothetical protein LHW51_11205 [Candidatus Cloacimonetes bacterium]|nr:hypothetical protein [Candidatus Cloacimonadota bacterium]